MNRKLLCLLFMLAFHILPALAQDTTYFDANWKVTVASNAAYFRLKTKLGSGWKVKDCYLSGKPQMEGAYSDDSCTVSSGAFSYYDENGNLYHACNYSRGQLDGLELLFYPNHQKRTEGRYISGKEDGECLGYYPSGKLSARARYKGGKQVSGSFFNEDGTTNKTVTEFSRDNSFPGGLPGLERFLIRNLKYPEWALNNNIEGTVYVGFNISKEGKVQDITLLGSVESSLDKEALRVVRLMPDWDPLIIGGILCDSHHIQPINFIIGE